MRRIIIIDKKIGSGDRIRALVDDINVICRPLDVQVSAFLQTDQASADIELLRDSAVVFLHHGNDYWAEFATKYCCGKDVILTSTAPDQRELEKVRLTPGARLLSRPVTQEDWLRLPWAKAIGAWREGEVFPLNVFLRDPSAAVVALDILCVGLLMMLRRTEVTEAFGGQKVRESAVSHTTGMVLENPSDWFRVGIAQLEFDIEAAGGRFWRELGENATDPEERKAAGAIRAFYQRFKDSNGAKPSSVSELITEAASVHEAFKTLWPRRYL